MKRKHLPQISNQDWYPKLLKTCMYEFLTWFVSKVHAAKPFMPIIEEGLAHTSTHKIINIDQEIGAGIETIIPYLPKTIEVKKIPLQQFNSKEKGLYTCINSFHLLKPNVAKKLISDIANSNQPVTVLEGNNNSLWQLFGMLIFVPLSVILSAPFVKPFRIERLVFTYLIPILPIVTSIDGIIALFKLYAPKDLNKLVSEIKVPNYTWRSGKLDNGRGGKIIYLIGFPNESQLI